MDIWICFCHGWLPFTSVLHFLSTFYLLIYELPQCGCPFMLCLITPINLFHVYAAMHTSASYAYFLSPEYMLSVLYTILAILLHEHAVLYVYDDSLRSFISWISRINMLFAMTLHHMYTVYYGFTPYICCLSWPWFHMSVIHVHAISHCFVKCCTQMYPAPTGCIYLSIPMSLWFWNALEMMICWVYCLFNLIISV